MKIKFYLIRHGQTDWNLEKRLQGRIDRSLTDLGRDQAQSAALALKHLSPRAIHSSTLSRARETAEIIAKQFTAPLFYEEDLQEGSYGEMEGMLVSEFLSKQPDPHHLPKETQLNRRICHNAETPYEIGVRFEKVLKKIISTHQRGDHLIVTHGGAIRGFLLLHSNFGFQELGFPSNGSIIVIEADKNGFYFPDSTERLFFQN